MPITTHNPWKVAEAVLGSSRRVLLRGKPGTGKTYTAVHSGLAEGQKVYQLTMTPDTPMAEVRGHFIQKGGEFPWHDGPAMRAWDEGARLVINEIDRASDDVLSFLYVIMDDPEFAETTLPNGEVRRPAEGFQVVCTMNGEIEDLPDALQDRLPVEIHITEMHPNAVKRLPQDLREAAKNSSFAPSDERSISIRMWMEYASLRDKIDPNVAAYAVFGEKAESVLRMLRLTDKAEPAYGVESKTGEEVPAEIVDRVQNVLRYLHTTGKNEGWKANKEYLARFLNRAVENLPKDYPEHTFRAPPPGIWETVKSYITFQRNIYIEVDGQKIYYGGVE